MIECEKCKNIMKGKLVPKGMSKEDFEHLFKRNFADCFIDNDTAIETFLNQQYYLEQNIRELKSLIRERDKEIENHKEKGILQFLRDYYMAKKKGGKKC